jgi:hypothetical protein
LKDLLKSHKALKSQLDTQQEQLEEIMKVLNNSVATSSAATTTTKSKGKAKEKQSEEFYQVSISIALDRCYYS